MAQNAVQQHTIAELLDRTQLAAMTKPEDLLSYEGLSINTLVSKHARVILSTVPGRGRCLRAAHDLPAFSEVLTDVAAAWLPPFCDQFAASMPALVERAPWLQALGPRALEALLVQMEPFASAAASDALPALPTVELFARAFRANGIGVSFDDRLPEDVRHLSAFAPVAAMLNHDCAANCMTSASWSAPDGAVAVRVSTVRPVAAGEELCISYVPRKGNRAERRAAVRRYGFECLCERCRRGDDGPEALAAAEASGVQAGVEDTIVYQCPECRGPVPHAALGATCTACGRQAPRASLRAWSKQRATSVAGLSSRDLASVVLDDEAMPCVHLSDVARCGIAYGRLSEGWSLAQREPAKAAAVLSRLAGVFESEAAHFWVGDVAQVLLLAGHVSVVRGDAAGAKGFYARAAVRFVGEYGAASAYGRVTQGLAEKPPKSRTEVEKAEIRRTAACNWVEACNLSAGLAARWAHAPVVFRSEHVRLPSGGMGPADLAERSSLDLLAAASRAVLRGSYTPGGPTLLDDPLVSKALGAGV